MLLLEKGKGIVKMITLAPEQCDEDMVQLLNGQWHSCFCRA